LNAERRESDWLDWRWQLRNAVGSVDDLARALPLTDGELEGARRAETEGLPIRITPYYLSLVDRMDPGCPIRRQCVPDARESVEVPGDLVDPLGEVAHEVAPHLVQRYPDRVLLLATDRCAVYCRFCTRSRIVGGGEGCLLYTSSRRGCCSRSRAPCPCRRRRRGPETRSPRRCPRSCAPRSRQSARSTRRASASPSRPTCRSGPASPTSRSARSPRARRRWCAARASRRRRTRPRPRCV